MSAPLHNTDLKNLFSYYIVLVIRMIIIYNFTVIFTRDVLLMDNAVSGIILTKYAQYRITLFSPFNT